MLKNIRKNLEFAAAGCIFAASNPKCSTNAAVPLRPAFFVANFFRNNSTTTPCRVSGNRPGDFAFRILTARSVVFLCLKTKCMTTKSFSGLLPLIGEWLGAESSMFTALCGERVTRREVVMTAVGLALLLAVIGLADAVATWVAGGVS